MPKVVGLGLEVVEIVVPATSMLPLQLTLVPNSSAISQILFDAGIDGTNAEC